MGNPFENAGISKTEGNLAKKVVSVEDFSDSERGFLAGIAESSLAKKMLKALAIMSGVMALNMAAPENVDAKERFPQGTYRTSNPSVDVHRFADGGIQRRAAKREFDRLNNQRIRAEERAEEEKGAAQAEREIFENGRPRHTSLGRRSSDHLISGPYSKGYFRVVRQWERSMDNAAKRAARESGKRIGQQRFEEQVERENRDPRDKSFEDISAGDVLNPLLDALRGEKK